MKKITFFILIIFLSCNNKNKSLSNENDVVKVVETEKEKANRILKELKIKDSIKLVELKARKDYPYPNVGNNQTMLDNYKWAIGNQPHQIREGLNKIKLRANPKNYSINKIQDGYKVKQWINKYEYFEQSFFSRKEAEDWIRKRTLIAQEEANSLYSILKKGKKN